MYAQLHRADAIGLSWTADVRATLGVGFVARGSGEAVRFGLLGSLEVTTDDGTPVDLGGAQPRAVLAILLAASGRVVPVDTLIESIWGDQVPPSASGTLQSYVSRLRREIEPDRVPGAQSRVLRWEPPGYRLEVDAVQVDFRRFEQCADEGRQLVDAGDASAGRERLVDALALWRGPALLEFADQEFARGLVARLEERRVAAIEDRVVADLALGRHATLAGELVQLVGEYPLREKLWAHLALALYRSGRQADALRALDEMRRTLRDQLGVDPSRPVRELEAQILAQDVTLDLARVRASTPVIAVAEPVPPATDDDAGIVGRDHELAQLVRALDDTVAGRVRFGIVEGEPGIGKTRLLEALTSAGSARGAVTRWGRCHEGGAAPAFWPWLEVLRAIVGSPGSGGSSDAELGQLLAPSADTGPSTPADRFRLFEAVARLLEDTGRQHPLLVVIDDIQWADPASLELLEFVAGRLDTSSVFVAVSVRELEMGRNDAIVRALVALTRRPGMCRIHLRGLPRDQTRVLVERATGIAAPPAVVAAIHERSEGNPFFVGELARLVVVDTVKSADDLLHRVGIPASVRDVVRQRLALLPEATRDLLQAAAVVGRDVEPEVLGHVLGVEIEQVLDDLEAAVTNRLLVDVPDAPATLRFSHALVREVVLDEASPLRKARLHRSAADAMIAIAGDTDDAAEIVAAHLSAAVSLGGRRRAADALVRASDVAVRRFAYESAEDLIQRAVQLNAWPVGDPDAAEAELRALTKYIAVLRSRYGYASVLSAPLDRVRELARDIGRHDVLHGLLWAEWAGFATACRLDVAERLATQMLDNGNESGDPVLRSVGLGAWGIQCWHYGRIAEAVEHLDAALAIRRAPDFPAVEPGPIAEALLLGDGFQLAMHEFVGDMPDVPDRFAALLAHASDPFTKVTLSNFSAYAAMICGDPTRAARAGRYALDIDLDGAFVFFGSACGMYWAWALSELGEIDDAVALFDEHFPRFVSTGVLTCAALHAANNACALARAGRLEDAIFMVDAAERLIDDRGELWQVPFVALARAEIDTARGVPASTVSVALREARDVAVKQGSQWLVHRIEDAVARLDAARK